MQALIDYLQQNLLSDLSREAFGMIGGTLFFGSWLLQSWESRRAGHPVVSARFFVIRALASLLLTFEGLRTGSLSITLVMSATALLMLYNLKLARARPRAE